MPLGTEIGLGPGDIVLDENPAPPRKWTQQPPLFGTCLLWPDDRPSQLLLSSCYSYIDVYVVRRTAALSTARLRRWSVADEMGCDACVSVDGGWSAWGPWSECSTTCGLDGLRRRERRCDNPLPRYDGRPCEGDTVETSTCPPTTECPGTIQIQIFIDTLAQKCLKATNMTHNKSIGTDTHTYTIRYDELYFRGPKSCRVASMICRA